MTLCDPGDVVLVRFPFTDLSTTKKRPALVVNPTKYAHRFGDVVLMALTSQPQAEDDLRLAEWKHCGLPKPTWIKPVVATVSIKTLLRTVGTLHQEDIPRVVRAVELLVAEGFRPNS